MNRDSDDHGAKSALRAAAHALGFLRVGIARAGISPHAERFREWLAAGRHGTMEYMARSVARRIDPRRTLPGAQSIVVVTLPYADRPAPTAQQASSGGGGRRGKIARYARGRDYHKVMRPRLKRLAELIAEGGRWQTWHAVDTAPILERDWAEAAGVGWIGKNALVLDPEHGSYFFLGVIVTDRIYPPDPPATDHCGACRACLDACPTGAFVAPHTVDARRCISYLTIEHHGDIEPALAGKLEGWVFGCDICQEVCPYNRRRMRVRPPPLADFEPRALPDDLEELASLDREQFVARFAGTAVMRTGVEGMRRNARLNLEREDK